MSERIEAAIALLRRNERLAVILVSTVSVMSGQGVMAPVLPLFAGSFGVGVAAIGLTLSVFALARLLLNVPLGLLADRYGRKLLLVNGPLVSACGMVGSGLAQDLEQLLAWRFLAGAGSAMYMTGAQVYLLDISTPSNRARVIAANQGALLLGVSIGPAIGGLLAEAYGFRIPFFAVGVASLITALYALLRLSETRRSPDSWATSDAGRGDAGPAVGERRPGWLGLLTSRDFLAVSGVTAAIFFTRAGGRMTLVPLLAAGSFDYSPGDLGTLFALMAAVNLAGIVPAAWLADRLGRKWAIVPSGGVIAAALWWMAGAGSGAGFVGAALLLAIGTAVIGPAPAAFVADITPPEQRGLAMGLYRTAGDAGFLIGPVALGALADATSIPWALSANALVFLLATSAFGIAARERNRPSVRR